MIAFLGSLEGRLPEEYIAKPTLPGSGAVVQEPVEDEGEPAEGEPSEDEAVEDEAQPEPEPAGEPG